jgi:hypothetical protein
MVIYDPRYMSWDAWASLLVEAYGSQQLTIPTNEAEWKEWADGLRGIDIFANDAVPSADGFDDWRDWAFALVNAVTTNPD